jgi:uncharacterized protein (DUF736 family)|tara:strand:- start:2646 stop:2882 length:237 start_codon:yes stop_codon:yes gene_type:complete
MPEYDNNNRGVLFKNTDKKTDKHPDYTGTATIENEDKYMSAWINESKSGKSYLKISFTKKEDTAPSQNTQTDSQDIPF